VVLILSAHRVLVLLAHLHISDTVWHICTPLMAQTLLCLLLCCCRWLTLGL
jgi:hypothetical protein